VLLATLLCGGFLIGFFGRSWSFFYDEWGTILYRRSGGFSAFFAAHNGHLQAVIVAIYRALFATVGLASYRPYHAVLILAHLALVALVYGFAKPRVGAWPALLLALPLLLLAHAWQVVFWTINLGFVLPLIALMAIIRWPRPEVTLIALGVALASSGLGVAVAAGVLLLALARPGRKRQLAAWAIPVGLYVIWWTTYRPHALPPASLRRIPGASATGDVGFIHFPSSNFGRAPGYVLHLAKATANAVIGTPSAGWWPLLILAVGVAAGLVVRRRLTPVLLALALTAIVFWVEVALSRAQFASPESFGASRYLYPGAFMVVLLVIETFAAVRVPLLMTLALGAGVAVIVASDIRMMDHFSGQIRVAFAREDRLLRRAQCDPRLPAGMTLDGDQAPGVTVGPYRAAVRALGSPSGQSC
jgi:hypothetical protein